MSFMTRRARQSLQVQHYGTLVTSRYFASLEGALRVCGQFVVAEDRFLLCDLARLLDANDIRTEIGEQQRAIRPGQEAREVEDSDVAQRHGRRATSRRAELRGVRRQTQAAIRDALRLRPKSGRAQGRLRSAAR
jgi:hypothetical protein